MRTFSIYVKTLSTSTLMQMKKAELVEYVRMCEKNMADAYATLDQQAVNFKKLLDEKTTADQWIPCSSGTLPADGRTVPVTTEFMNRRHITTATYYTKKGVVDDYEWTGRGFYQYDSEYGYGRLNDVVAWLNVEPYKEGEKE